MMALTICVVSITFLFYQSSNGLSVIDVSELNAKYPEYAFDGSEKRAESNADSLGSQTSGDDVDFRPADEQSEYVYSELSSTDNNDIVRSGSHRQQVKDYLQRRRLYEYSVTATPKPATTNLNDIFISVKTTKMYHDTRLDIIIKTWFQLAPDQVSGRVPFLRCFSLSSSSSCLLASLSAIRTPAEIEWRGRQAKRSDVLHAHNPEKSFRLQQLRNNNVL